MAEVITDQVAFATVVTHMLDQGKAAIDVDGACVYWNQDTGMKCAIGCLIKEEDYNPDMEENGVEGLIRLNLLPEYLKSVDLHLLCDLQSVHDAADINGWLGQLTKLATKYNLNMPQVDYNGR